MKSILTLVLTFGASCLVGCAANPAQEDGRPPTFTFSHIKSDGNGPTTIASSQAGLALDALECPPGSANTLGGQTREYFADLNSPIRFTLLASDLGGVRSLRVITRVRDDADGIEFDDVSISNQNQVDEIQVGTQIIESTIYVPFATPRRTEFVSLEISDIDAERIEFYVYASDFAGNQSSLPIINGGIATNRIVVHDISACNT